MIGGQDKDSCGKSGTNDPTGAYATRWLSARVKRSLARKSTAVS
ncbi:hypothetical protein P4664_25115 [Priestia megaterium]|nr:hypothetical protein [Priestia megaterium]